MRAIKVEYTVEPTFAETNAANIQTVMNALRENPIDGVSYMALLKSDNQTFVHLVIARDEEAQSRLPELSEFRAFQEALKNSNPISPPNPEEWSVIGTSFEM